MRINRKIRVREVRLIDQDGKQVGIVPTDQAQRLADAAGLDLVEVVPNSTPPVCKIIDYGKYRYDQTKREKESKKAQHQIKVKEVKVKPNISDHDLDVKVKRAHGFLEKGNKVKLTCMFRGREMAHKDVGLEVMNRVIHSLDDMGQAESTPKMYGRTMQVVISPKTKKK